MPKLVTQLELHKCPHCGVDNPLLPIVINKFSTERHSGGYKRYWATFRCATCGGVVLAGSNKEEGDIKEMYPSGIKETFDCSYLPQDVEDDFTEALTCYSNSCLNAFGSMCRRCVQSVSTNLGAKGSDRVLNQLKELKDMAQIDDETFNVLKQIIIAGHDGAHPHLPTLSSERAKMLLELMKDVLYQIYIRKAKIQEVIKLRKNTITQK